MFHTFNHLLLWVFSLLGLSSIFLILINYSNEQPDSQAVKPITNTNASNQPEIEELRQECLRLREQLQQQNIQLTTEFQESTFKQIQTLLTNYPSLRPMVQVKPELPAKNIISLLTPLDNLLSTWGYELIGQAWEQVEYDPQLHQPDNSDIQPGELVFVRFVGYRQGERILVPAKVSRTLPGGAS
ncbi:hypothetical protein Cri9333_2010 [Crinalium epipsammum PCC 9333]|uniref:Molecular chaperone GrpE (Heat shock protein) n=1 Tax=Crinalium epipsammum PCC 9333 TaxID=1173022 RepID=K9VZB7_9CYAN|nr:hypothetical protein [Crinalium epipsammum]AFZ12889.1 hypothetical protein Cri9333_2010 [Crinalium epipsammum PCC 9333]